MKGTIVITIRENPKINDTYKIEKKNLFSFNYSNIIE